MVEKTYKRIKKYFQLKIIGSLFLPFVLSINFAYAQGVRLISDAETEQLLLDLAKPLFEAAKIPFENREIYIVEDNSLNAFVAEGNNLFVHTGTIMAAQSPDELSGVIAHEIGHIAGGHILRQKLKNKSLQEVSLFSVIAAGAAAVISGNPDVAMAAMLGTQNSVLTNYTMYRTSEERSADETAIGLLKQTKQSPQGMLNFMKKLANHTKLQGIEETPYFRTHPLTQERISFFEQAVKKYSYPTTFNLQHRFDMVKAKLKAFLQTPEQTLRQYPINDKSGPAQYARTIAYFKQLKLSLAQQELAKLLQKNPDNPYFYELKGQIYLETGKANNAKIEYQKALQLLPNSPLLQISLAQAILEAQPNVDDVQQAINLINKAMIKRPTAFGWLLLARAYGAQKRYAHAQYASAEYSVRIGAIDTAKLQLKKALEFKPDAQLKLKISDLSEKIK